MNERIRQLAIKNASPWMTDMGQLYPDIEKFAELIVRECAEVASDYDGAHYVGTAIKEHFGVE